MENQLRLDAKGWGMLLLLSTLWGGSFLFVEIALESMSPMSIVATRVGLAAMGSYVLLKITSQAMPKDLELWRAFFVMGVVNNIIPFLLIVWGQQYILGGVAAILTASTPAFTVLVAQIFTNDEKLSVQKIIGLSIAIFGVVIVIGFDTLSNFSMGNLGQLAIILAALSYAVASVFGRRFGKAGIAPLSVTTGQLMVGAILLVPLALIMDPGVLTRSISPKVAIALVGLALVSTALAYLLYFKLIETAGATNATLVTVLVPVSAVILTWAILDEKLPGTAIEGMIVIGIGLLTLDGRLVLWAKKLAIQ